MTEGKLAREELCALRSVLSTVLFPGLLAQADLQAVLPTAGVGVSPPLPCLPGLASPATDPVTEGFFGTSLFGRLVSRRQSRRDSEASGPAEAGGRSRRGSWAANTELVSVLDREQLATPRDTRCHPAPPRPAQL